MSVDETQTNNLTVLEFYAKDTIQKGYYVYESFFGNYTEQLNNVEPRPPHPYIALNVTL